MCHMDQVTGAQDGGPLAIDLKGLQAHGSWGLFHELGAVLNCLLRRLSGFSFLLN